ncbi:MAG: hypothetical protein KGO22_13130, partial [Gammaproteobacteria bacterium]|nr:hypothetical protein [Gammaproteobacteria bacterium]
MRSPSHILSSPAGLRAEISASGAVRRLDCGQTALTLFIGSEVESGPANLYLRRRSDKPAHTPLLGPASPTRLA